MESSHSERKGQLLVASFMGTHVHAQGLPLHGPVTPKAPSPKDVPLQTLQDRILAQHCRQSAILRMLF